MMQTELFTHKQKKVKKSYNSSNNKLNQIDRPFHDWYRFVLSFPPHLVREYIDKFELKPGDTILDPFCGTGTTLVEARLSGINSIGIEANPMAYFASQVKVDWSVNPTDLLDHAKSIANEATEKIKNYHHPVLKTLPPDAFDLLLKNSISPLPLHKALILLETIKSFKDEEFHNHELLAFAKMAVSHASNLHFGPEVGVNRLRKKDAPVIESWISEVRKIVNDLIFNKPNSEVNAVALHGDSRKLHNYLKPSSISAVFTSPPYPNEKDYTRTTRLESVLLGFINNKDDLRAIKKGLIRSNTRNVYKEDNDDEWISDQQQILNIARTIENRRIELGKTSGFEKMYSRVTKLYFGGMARHLADLRKILKNGAYLGYVVGDQASYLRVMIRTGSLLADIAQSLGYELVNIDLFRTRFATATKEHINEEVVVLKWNGTKN